MANGGSIKYSVGFNVDKAGLNQIKASLQEIQRLTAQDLVKINNTSLDKANKDLKELQSSVKLLEGALDKAFNTNLGTLNVTKFNQELKKLNLNKIYQDFSNAGAAGQAAFRNTTAQILTTNMQLKQTHKLLDNMATTMANTIKWGVASSVMDSFTGSVQQAYGYVKSLDSSLNDIRIVTGYSAEAMDKFAVKANKAAKALGQSTTDYTEASLIYYQQGLSDKEVEARTETTLKAANVTGQSGQEVSEQLTAVWNGYKVTAEEAELYVDKLAAVAASTASDLEELSTGMSKVASAANAMGVDVDQLNAQLATIVSVTRQAPESVGTALKTIYARISDLKMGETDEDGLGLGDVSGTMEQMGIKILDETGNLRDMGKVVEDVAAKWDTWTKAQQTAMAQVMAGKRQYNNLVALFENWDMYEEALNTSENSMGTLQKQQDIYMESTAAHLQQLRTASEDLYDSLLDPKGLNPLIDGLATLTGGMATFVDSIGGGTGVLLNFGSIGAKVFSKQIAQGIATTIVNFKNAKDNAIQLQAQMELLSQFKGLDIQDSTTQKLIGWKQEIISLGALVTEEQHNEASAIIKSTNEIQNEADAWEESKRQAEQYLKTTESFSGKKITNINKQDAEKVNSNLDKEIRNYQEAIKESKSYENTVDTLSKAIASQNNVFREHVAGSEEVKEAERATAAALQDTRDAMDNLKSSSESVLRSIDKTSGEYTELRNAIKEYNLAVADGDQTKIQQSAEKLVQAYQNANIKLQQQAKNTKNIVSQEAHGATQNFKNAIQQAEQTWNNFISKLKLTQQIQQVVSLVSSIGQLTSVINTIINMGDIINDDSLSNGEKALRIISAISMAIPMLVSGIGGIGKSLVGLSVAFGLVESAEAGAAMGAKALGVEIWKALSPILPYILAISAVIGVVAFAIHSAVKAYNADADAAKKASENAEELKTKYQELTSAAEEFKKTISSYEEGVNALKELDRNSDEYKAKLEELNAQAKELIETYDLYGKYQYEDGLIKIDLDELRQAQEEIEKLANFTERQYLAAKIHANDKRLTSDATNLGRSLDKVYDKNMMTGQNSSGGYRDLNSSEVKALANAMRDLQEETEKAEGVTEAVNLSADELKAKLTESAEEYGLSITVMENLDSIIEDETIDSLYDFVDSVEAAEEANLAYAKEILGLLAQDTYGDITTKLATDENGEVDEVLKTQLDQAMGSMVAKVEKDGQNIAETATARLKEGKDAIVAGGWDNADSTETAIKNFADKYGISVSDASKEAFGVGYGGNISTQTMAERYFESQGKNNVTVSDKSGKNIVEWTDEEGVHSEELSNEQIQQMWADAMTQAIVDLKTSEDMKSVISEDQMESTLGRVKEAPDAYGVDWSSELLEGIANDNNFDFSSAFAKLSEEEVAELNAMSEEELMEMLGITEEDLKALGMDKAGDFASAFKEGLEGYDKESADDAADAEGDKKAEALDLDVDELDAYRELLADTYEELDNNREALNEVAIANKRMEKGVKTLAKGWEDFDDIMSDSDSSMEDISSVLPDINEGLQDVLNLSDEEFELLPPDFAQKNWSLIQDVVNGVEGAVDELRDKAGQEILMNIDGVVDPTGQINADLMNIHNSIVAMDQTQFEVGVAIDPAQHAAFIENCNSLIQAAGMTAEQAQAYFASMGYDVELKEVKPQSTDTSTYSYYELDEAATEKAGGVPQFKKSPTTISVSSTTGATAYAIETITPTGSYGGGVGVNTTAPKSSTSGKKSSGGGGGGGKSSSKPKTEKKIETKKDRYHDVNVKLEQIDENLEDIGREQEKVFGKDLIDNLNKELEILEKQRDVLEEKLEIAKEEQRELQDSLANQGVQFNEDGTIANYLSIVQQKEDYINKLIDQYNSLSADAQDEFKENTLDPAMDAYDEFMETLEHYDEVLLETIPEIENTIQDTLDREVEIAIQKLNMEVELRLDLTEAQKDWNEFKREIIDGIDEDDIFGNALKDAELFETLLNNGTTEALTNNLQTTMDEINAINTTGFSDIFGTDKNAAIENLDEQMSNLMDHLTELADIEKAITEAYMDMIDEVGEAFDEQIESYEFVGDLIEHNMNMIQLLKGDDAYADLAKIYEEQEKNNLKQIESQKQAVEYYRQMMETEIDPEALDEWTELWKDAVSDLNGLVEESVETIIDKYTNTINVIFDELNDKLTSGKGLEYLTQQWELQNENADQYLDTINSTYEIQKLERKIQESIDSSDSISAQRQLNKLMEDELKKLREKDKLTQYDVDRANQMYEIKLKEIALEEAQKNKSQMRLRRDASGNYSYQFVADQDSISAAQQELDDARNSLYNMDKDQYRENQQAILDVYTEFQEKMRNAANMSAEERALIEQEYTTRINNLLEENGYIRTNLMESAFADMAALYDSDIANFQSMSDSEKEILMNQIVPNWDSGIQLMIDKMAGEGGFGPTCENAFYQLDEATKQYNDSLALIEQTAGTTFEAMSTGYNENIELANGLADAQQENINRTIEEKDAIGELKTEVEALKTEYDNVYESAKKALEAAQALREAEKKAAAEAAAAEEQKRQQQQQNSGSGASGDGGSSGSGSSGDKSVSVSNIKIGDKLKYIGGTYYYDSSGMNPTGNRGAGKAVTVQNINKGAKYPIAVKSTDSAYGWLKENQLQKYDTGGYTGDWNGEEGKPAILHKKELVLNADDTKNFLSAIKIVRDMESILNSLNDSMLSRTTGMTSTLFGGYGSLGSSENSVNQNVQIQASFPGVSVRGEIEQAFENLVNMASQHAFNTQR